LPNPKTEPDRFMAVRTYFVFEEILSTITAKRNSTHITIGPLRTSMIIQIKNY
jgi:hypothetical protein